MEKKSKLLCYCLKCDKNFFANELIAKRVKRGKKVIIFCVFCNSASDIIHYKETQEMKYDRRTMEKRKNTECVTKF